MVAPAAVNAKVVVVRVAGFIGLLKVAVMTAVLGQTSVEPFGGVTVITVGGVRGSPGLPVPARLSESPQPAIRTANKSAGIQTLETFSMRICISSSPSHNPF